MTRNAWMGAAVLVAGLGGCLPNNFIVPSGDKADAKAVEPPRSVMAPPVTAGQINGVNAQEKAQALRQELDRDMERALEASDPKEKK
jgi:hypothetical protein